MNADIEKKVRETMGGSFTSQQGSTWSQPPGGGSVDPAVKAWTRDMYAWACRVRRDILVLEQHLKATKNLKDDDFYGDPGDPPPPIE